KVGQQARVYVDAYPGEIFEGVVSFIAHEAEFTPRNVQTKEERVNLVFGVKITLDNPDHRLKPGMPADAELEEWKDGGMEGWRNGGAAEGEPIIQPTNTPTLPAERQDEASQPSPTSTPKLAATPTPQPSNPPTLQPETTETTQAEIITWGLNVRSGPGVNYPVAAHLAQGTIVPVLEIDPDTGWLQVELPGSQETGWISNNPAYVLVK
ncbi:MAG TPA: SH3 domain-containing protein, partial [Anaerolineae bacterium]|nr:SH3 domain-containing protein [Anaerolineae bacterium]